MAANPFPAFERELADVAARVTRSVVHVRRRGKAGRTGPGRPVEGAGSGVILDPVGLVVTNRHVVHGAPGLGVVLPDGDERTGTLLGEDAGTDLALVRVDGHGFPSLRLADSANLR